MPGRGACGECLRQMGVRTLLLKQWTTQIVYTLPQHLGLWLPPAAAIAAASRLAAAISSKARWYRYRQMRIPRRHWASSAGSWWASCGWVYYQVLWRCRRCWLCLRHVSCCLYDHVVIQRVVDSVSKLCHLTRHRRLFTWSVGICCCCYIGGCRG